MPAGTYRPLILHFAFRSPPSQAHPNEILTRSLILLNVAPSRRAAASVWGPSRSLSSSRSCGERGQPPCKGTSFHSIVSSIPFHHSALGAGDHQWGSEWRLTAKNWLESSIMFQLTSLCSTEATAARDQQSISRSSGFICEKDHKYVNSTHESSGYTHLICKRFLFSRVLLFLALSSKLHYT